MRRLALQEESVPLLVSLLGGWDKGGEYPSCKSTHSSNGDGEQRKYDQSLKRVPLPYFTCLRIMRNHEDCATSR